MLSNDFEQYWDKSLQIYDFCDWHGFEKKHHNIFEIFKAI